MRLGHCFFDKTIDEYHKDIADLIIDKKTLIFIDTNILSYLFKLHSNARNEFFSWANNIIKENRFFIPEWAANEYLNKVTSNKLTEYSHKSINPNTANNAYNSLHEMASLFVDDELLKKSNLTENREQYLDNFKKMIEDIHKYTEPFKKQFNVNDVHNEIEKNFSKIVLKSDISSMFKQATSEGPSRYEHRLPPGFKDNSKSENRFGDLIIWFEILEKSKSEIENFNNVIFLTNDEKSDWVYAPNQIAHDTNSNQRKSIPNKEPILKIVDPRLISEFQSKVGHSNLAICNLATVIESLSKNVDTSRFKNIAGAIQININKIIDDNYDENKTNINDEKLDHNVTNYNTSNDEFDNNFNIETSSHHEYELEALHDSLYSFDNPLKINNIIRDLKSHNWYTQNPAILKVNSLIKEEFSSSSYFVLGRNIYQAACGHSVKAMDYISSLSNNLDLFSEEVANHILSGMLFEIYFDSKGQYRNDIKFGFADKTLSLLSKDKYIQTKEFIIKHLNNTARSLLYIPGDTKFYNLSIKYTPDTNVENNFILTSVKLNEYELIIDMKEKERQFYWDLDLIELKDEISQNLLIPSWSIKYTGDIPKGTLNIPERMKIASLLDII